MMALLAPHASRVQFSRSSRTAARSASSELKLGGLPRFEGKRGGCL